jgi:flagellar biosynthesis/type III secretory pathway protein FliH
MLSNLRKLQPQIIKTIEDMSLNYDIQTDLRYLQGVEQGFEQGIEKGIEKGAEKAASEKDYQFAKSLILSTDFDNEKIAALVGVTIGYVVNLRVSLSSL